MMNFRTMYDDFERTYSNPGSPEEPVYAPVVDDNGCISLEVVGTMDIASYIDSFRESCDLNVILARYANGDASFIRLMNGLLASRLASKISNAPRSAAKSTDDE